MLKKQWLVGCALVGMVMGVQAKPVATVNGVAIEEAEVEQMLKMAGKEASRQQVVDALIQVEVVRQQVKKKKLDQREDVNKQVARYKDELTRQVYLQEEMATMTISPKEYAEAYREYTKQLAAKTYHLSDILVNKEDDAKGILAKLKKGADFADLAKARSQGPNALQGGELGWLPLNVVPKSFQQAVPDATLGTYINTPLKSEFGYHVVWVHEARKADSPPLETIKPQLRQVLLQQKVAQHVEKLVKEADISR
jgi:peptidyl-prolyl cis-trans isomerase C